MDATKNFVHHAFDWCAGVDCASLSNAFLGFVQADDDFSFLLPSAPVAGVNEYALVNPLQHRVKVIEFEDKHAVEKLDEFRRIPRAAAEKRHGLVVVCEQALDFPYIPEGREVMFGSADARGVICFQLAPEFPVAVNGLIAPSSQLVADRGFASAGAAVNQIVPNAHTDHRRALFPSHRHATPGPPIANPTEHA
jgi:hypothetical protein